MYIEGTSSHSLPMMQRNSFLNIHTIAATLVVGLSMVSGFFLTGLLTGHPTTATAATIPASLPYAESARGNDDLHQPTPVSSIKLPAFSSIEVASPLTVIIRQGAYPGFVEAEGSAEAILNLHAAVNDGVLGLRYNLNNNDHEDMVTIHITVPDLESINASMAASLKVDSIFNIKDRLEVSASAASVISFGEVTGHRLDIHAESASDIFALVVDMDSVDIEALSASNVKLRGMSVCDVSARASSAAGITLSGRCNRSEVKAITGSEIKTRGLITERMPIRRKSELSSSKPRKP